MLGCVLRLQFENDFKTNHHSRKEELSFVLFEKVDRIDSYTVMVMKSLKFGASARFVRIVLPPFDKRMKIGKEMPGYKVELFRCSNNGSAWRGNTGIER